MCIEIQTSARIIAPTIPFPPSPASISQIVLCFHLHHRLLYRMVNTGYLCWSNSVNYRKIIANALTLPLHSNPIEFFFNIPPILFLTGVCDVIHYKPSRCSYLRILSSDFLRLDCIPKSCLRNILYPDMTTNSNQPPPKISKSLNIPLPIINLFYVTHTNPKSYQ